MSEQKRLKMAYRLIKDGERERASHIISDVLKGDPNNVNAWLLAGRAAKSAKTRQKCFKRALKLDPGNATAERALAQIERKRAERAEQLGQAAEIFGNLTKAALSERRFRALQSEEGQEALRERGIYTDEADMQDLQQQQVREVFEDDDNEGEGEAGGGSFWWQVDIIRINNIPIPVPRFVSFAFAGLIAIGIALIWGWTLLTGNDPSSVGAGGTGAVQALPTVTPATAAWQGWEQAGRSVRLSGDVQVIDELSYNNRIYSTIRNRESEGWIVRTQGRGTLTAEFTFTASDNLEDMLVYVVPQNSPIDLDRGYSGEWQTESTYRYNIDLPSSGYYLLVLAVELTPDTRVAEYYLTTQFRRR